LCDGGCLLVILIGRRHRLVAVIDLVALIGDVVAVAVVDRRCSAGPAASESDGRPSGGAPRRSGGPTRGGPEVGALEGCDRIPPIPQLGRRGTAPAFRARRLVGHARLQSPARATTGTRGRRNLRIAGHVEKSNSRSAPGGTAGRRIASEAGSKHFYSPSVAISSRLSTERLFSLSVSTSSRWLSMIVWT
jgi:hypothetical protein